MNKRVVYIGNLHVLAAAVDALREDAADASGVCVVHGAAGIGKTWALRHVAGKFNALFCTALPFWTPHAMLTALARALDEAPLARTTALFAQLTQALSAAPRPIIIDEADRIADRPVLLETLRILHDLTGAPLVFAGMDEMRRAIARRPQIRCRILHAIEFQPLTLDDARKIAAERSQIPIADDLIEELRRRSGGIAGLYCHSLAAAERYARRRNEATPSAPEPGATPGRESAPLELREYRERLGPATGVARASRTTAMTVAAAA
ncbi:MAG TPA: ATP-binding protein, partial [Candidatus Binataceae bacterium]|nr:ATP-binding protein [Candidatus Binataceae bacterium]